MVRRNRHTTGSVRSQLPYAESRILSPIVLAVLNGGSLFGALVASRAADGFVANYYRTNVRAAGVAWCAGFGRLGGTGGPMLGGTLIGAGFKLDSIFYVLARLGLLGVMLTLLVPMARAQLAQRPAHADPVPTPALPCKRAA
jgi:predicted lipid-binding transport protein (Tim44 family)